jgi:hypothetical protein
MCLPPNSINDDATSQCVSPSSPLIHIPSSFDTLDNQPPNLPTSPPPPPPPLVDNQPPNLPASPHVIHQITKTYSHRPRHPIPIPTSSDSPNAPSLANFTNNDESCAISDETQVGPRYNLQNHATIEPPDKLGFPSATDVVDEPSTYQEASSIPQLAMSAELAALDLQGTLELVPLPSHVVPTTSKWVFKMKTKSDGSIERYKARLVAQGFSRLQDWIMKGHLPLLLT